MHGFEHDVRTKCWFQGYRVPGFENTGYMVCIKVEGSLLFLQWFQWYRVKGMGT